MTTKEESEADALVAAFYEKVEAEYGDAIDRLLEHEMLFGPQPCTIAVSNAWDLMSIENALDDVAAGLVSKAAMKPPEPLKTSPFVPPEECNKWIETPDGGCKITFDVQRIGSTDISFTPADPASFFSEPEVPDSVQKPKWPEAMRAALEAERHLAESYSGLAFKVVSIDGVDVPAFSADFDDTTEPSAPSKRSDEPTPAWLSTEAPAATSQACGCMTIDGITFSCIACAKGGA